MSLSILMGLVTPIRAKARFGKGDRFLCEELDEPIDWFGCGGV